MFFFSHPFYFFTIFSKPNHANPCMIGNSILMRKIRNKILLVLSRHPLLYYFRYLLLSKNAKADAVESMGCFNDINATEAVPDLYFEVNWRIKLSDGMDTLEKALEIGRYLRFNIKGGRGLGLSSGHTLEKMLAGQGGVCSDFSQIFSLFCLVNRIKVREWGCVESFYKGRFGHSFNEIYSRELKKWVAIDIEKNIVFKDSDGKYLSAIEVFGALRKGKPVVFHHFSSYVLPNPERIAQVYSADTIPFLIDNYRNSVNDYFCSKFNEFPPVVINAIMILYRKNYKFVFVMDNYKVKLLPKRLQAMAG
jgi:hypothetical protein